MAKLSLTIACGPYDRMEGIRTGAVQIEGIDAVYVPIQSPPEIFARMMKTHAFDVSEMSLSTYLGGRSRGDFVALPVFPSRMFRHGSIFVNTNAGTLGPTAWSPTGARSRPLPDISRSKDLSAAGSTSTTGSCRSSENADPR